MPPNDTERPRSHQDASSATHAVVEAVAHERDRDPTELPPLYHTIEPDALDGIISPNGDPHNIRLIFNYAGCEVTVIREDTVTVDVCPE